MSYYDTEAPRYDETRGGVARAEEAARAIRRLLPGDARVVLDVAGGTGIVGERVGRTVCSVDRSRGMSALAATRLPGRVTLGEATALPVASGSVDAVTLIWLLHLLDGPESAAVVAEAARVLRPGGTLITTVDKAAAQFATPDDVGALLGPWAGRRAVSDDPARITGLARDHGLLPAGETTFAGVGQGCSPREWRAIRDDPRLAALPGQDRKRADPTYRLAAFRRG